nr:MAG TPA: hypothetical protein [Caudoviricetes sp.]
MKVSNTWSMRNPICALLFILSSPFKVYANII